MPGLLSFFNDPEQMGLLGLSSGLLQAGGPSKLPVGFGQALGVGVQQGAQAAQATQQFNDTTKLRGLQSRGIELSNAGAERQQKALDDFANSLPPDQRGLFLANPAAYIKSLTEGYTLSPGQQRVQGGKVVAKVSPNLTFQSVGDAIVGLRPDTGEVATNPLKLGVSPDARARIDFDKFQYSNLSANQLANLANDRARLGLQAADTFYNTGLSPLPGLLPSIPSIAPQRGIQPAVLGGQTPGGLPLSPRQQAEIAAAGPKATAAKLGEAQAQATLDLPGATTSAEQLDNVIDQMIGTKGRTLKPGESARAPHAGFNQVVGATLTPGLRFVPGTEAANFQALLDQAKGGAFLQAYQLLKGGGQITEVEGKKAEDALARMRTAQTEAAFIGAARDFQKVYHAGVEKLKKFSAGNFSAPAGGNGWSIEPLP